ncbi:MAG: hypothetical protein GY740_01470, partial [Gammaproteobacteria bacterium]|nr:hypothetical protein [Gammaproteobacteria bacterium]
HMETFPSLESVLNFSIMPECMYCSKGFSTDSNRLRHQRLIHGENKNDQEESETESDNGSSGAEDSEEEVSNAKDKEEDKDEEEGDEETLDDNSVWASILQNALEDIDFPVGATTIADILDSKDNVKLIIKCMGETVHYWEQIIDFLLKDSKIFEKLMKTRERLINKEDYSMEDATGKAFTDRKNMLKQVIENNTDILKKFLPKKKEGDDSDGNMDSDDNE